MHYLANRKTRSDSDISVLHDANKDWIRAQAVMVLPLHGMPYKASLIALFALYPEGVRVKAIDAGCLFTLRILEEPDEEVTPEDIITTKLLVVLARVGQHSSHTIDPEHDSDDPDDPDESTHCTMPPGRGS
jgi:hypothetical protein